MIDPADIAAVHAQLGRPPRDIVAIANRCACGQPCVVTTPPRLADGTPFPTTYYLTCPKLAGAIGTLEGAGLMKEMENRLQESSELREKYLRAHERYLADRAELGEVPEVEGISAGGMPDRVKCLHVLVGQSLACGPGVNPLGDEVLELIGSWWTADACSVIVPDDSNHD
ncbi:MAG: DUF501 domain-containing protein [Candidatus Nanopelagicales bacterium]|nr:DUF501 domain-containing protein [Candidatus Nanopelagicales bacterium]